MNRYWSGAFIVAARSECVPREETFRPLAWPRRPRAVHAAYLKGMNDRNTPKRWATRSLWARPRLGTALADRAAYRFEAEFFEQLVHRVSATSLACDPC